MKRAASWFLCLLCPLTTVDCSRAPTAPAALSSTLISRTSFEEDTVLGEKTTFDTWFQTLFLTPTPVVLGGHVFDYRAVSMLRQTTQRLNVCHNCFAMYPHEQWVAFRWYVKLVWGQWASAVTTWSSVLEHLSCDKKTLNHTLFPGQIQLLFIPGGSGLWCKATIQGSGKEENQTDLRNVWFVSISCGSSVRGVDFCPS